MEPKISIIIPVYNSEVYLKRCIDSVLNQTYQNIEVILINDGSIDQSREICDSYKENRKVKVKHIKNSGAGGARNIGLKLATGDYISFVDSDDWIHPEMLKVMLSVLKRNNVQLVECDLIKVDSVLENSNIGNNYRIILESRMDTLKRIIKNQRFSVVIRLYKKELLNNIFFIENIMSEDVYFTYRVISKINALARIPLALYYYYYNAQSVTKQPYSLKQLDTLDSALYIQTEVLQNENDLKLIEITRKFMLEILLYNYNQLNYNSNLDVSLVHRKKIKQLIKENYTKKNNASLHLKLARYTPIYFFSLLATFYAFIKKNK